MTVAGMTVNYFVMTVQIRKVYNTTKNSRTVGVGLRGTDLGVRSRELGVGCPHSTTYCSDVQESGLN